MLICILFFGVEIGAALYFIFRVLAEVPHYHIFAFAYVIAGKQTFYYKRNHAVEDESQAIFINQLDYHFTHTQNCLSLSNISNVKNIRDLFFAVLLGAFFYLTIYLYRKIKENNKKHQMPKPPVEKPLVAEA